MSNIVSYAYTDRGVVPDVLWIYPKGCQPPFPDSYYTIDIKRSSGTRYVPESREKPKTNLTRLENLTSRERVFSTEAQYGSMWHSSFISCPHGGIHGTAEVRYYYTYLHSDPGLIPDDSLVNKDLWVTAMRRKVSDQKYNLGSQVAEYRETVQAFVSLIKTMHNAYQILRGRMPRKKLRLSEVPATVLKYNFGVAPLAEDVFSAVEILRLKLKQPITRRLSAGVTFPIDTTRSIGPLSYSGSGSLKQRATIYYDLNPDVVLSDEFDFGNPIEWAWELIPFSFVVDWVIPVGDYLGLLDAMVGTTNLRGTVVRKVETKWTYRVDGFPSGEPSSGWYKSYSRDVITDVPMPPLPGYSPSRSWRSLLNAVSLLGVLKLSK